MKILLIPNGGQKQKHTQYKSHNLNSKFWKFKMETLLYLCNKSFNFNKRWCANVHLLLCIVGLLLLLARWRGMHYWHSYVIRMSLLLLLDHFWRLLWVLTYWAL